MQPYFFPYLGHFSLIAAVDEWVVFDITQYTPKSWMSRNRVLHPKEGWQYVNVPLSNSSISIKTHEARILDLDATRRALLGKLSHYKGRAPFYRATLGVVERTFERCQGRDDLVALNVAGLQEVCAHLQLPFRHRVCSALQLDFPTGLQAGDWALHISRQLGATHYLNPASGRDIFDPVKFAAQGIALQFLQPLPFAYATPPYQHEAHLSVLDALMWNAPEQLLDAIRERAVIA
ncbi:MAG: WbqC family protein [Comamonadaceae bacterium]|nr:WbqC family protein [Comamonadaceae bacterium]